MKTAVVILLLVTLAFSSEDDETLKRQSKGIGNCFSHLKLGDFDNWKSKSGRKYERCGSEHNKRFQNYLSNVANIEKLKKLFPTADFDTNEFSDLSLEEFKAMYTGLKASPPDNEDMKRGITEVLQTSAQQWDWSSYSTFGLGLTTPIKNQGQCGSCWAHATTSTAESQIRISTGVNQILSQQQLIDCYMSGSTPYGCNGGPIALTYVQNNGLVSEAAYLPTSYTTQVAGTCKNPSETRKKITSAVTAAPATDDELAASIVANGPHVVGMYASNTAIQNYKSGIVTASACGFNGKNYDHAVVVVGFNKCANPPYWIVQNSWGSNWGEKGFFRLEYGANACGIVGTSSFRPQYAKVNAVAWNKPAYPSGQCPTPTNPTPPPTNPTPTKPTPTPPPTNPIPPPTNPIPPPTNPIPPPTNPIPPPTNPIPPPTNPIPPPTSSNCKTIAYFGSLPCVKPPTNVVVQNTDMSKYCFNYQNSGNMRCFTENDPSITSFTIYPCQCTTTNALQGDEQPITLSSSGEPLSEGHAFSGGEFAGIIIGTILVTLLVSIFIIAVYKYVTK